jgi:aspartyl-tRNA(Asn)/glutamyl-tRNA(Gln) amidotransferase subunit A
VKPGSARANDAVETKELARLSAVELLNGYRCGLFTPRDVIEDVIAALEQIDASCNVVVTSTYDQARAAADEATRTWASGRPQGGAAGGRAGQYQGSRLRGGRAGVRRRAHEQGPGADR